MSFVNGRSAKWSMYDDDVLPSHFAEMGRGFARLNIGTSRAIIEEAVNRMARAVAIPN